MTAKEQIINRLKTFRQKEFNNELTFSLLAIFSIIVFLLTLMIIFFIPLFILFAALPFIVILLRNLIVRKSLTQIAKQIEAGFPQLVGYLVNAVELANYPSDAKEGYSPELINAAIEDAQVKLAPIPLTKLINRQKTRTALFGFLFALALLVSCPLFFPNRAKLGFYATFAPNKTPIEFVVAPGNLRVNKDSKVTLQVTINSPFRFREALLILRRHNPPAADKIIKKRLFLQVHTGSIDVQASSEMDYSFKVFNRQSPIYHIGLLKPLALTSLFFKLNYPAYTKRPVETTQAQTISVLPGTKIEVSGIAETKLDSGRIWFSDSTIIPLALSDNKFLGSFTAKKDINFVIRLKDIVGNTNEPEVFKLTIAPDEAPYIKLFLPGRDIDLPVSMKVLLGVNSIDDYGLTNLALYYEKDSVIKKIHLKNVAGRQEDTTYYYWDLANIGFMPGEVIRYYASVSDNDVISGPKLSKTEVFTIRFPTVAEIYSQTTKKTFETKERLEPMAAEQEELGKELDRIDQELKKERRLGWEERNSLENLVSNQKKLLDQIEELKEEVKTALENMFEGLMLDKESIEKLKELERLLSELLPQELKEALRNLAQALENKSPDLKQAMERFKLSQEELKKAIERAVELLKNIEEEEKLKALAKKAEALYQMQKEIEKRIKELPKDSEKLATDENKIKEELESLEKAMEEIAKEMSDKEIAEELSKLLTELSKPKPSAQAMELSQSLAQGDKGNAQQQSQRLLKDLAHLKDALGALAQKLASRRSSEISEKLLNSARDLTTLSFEQERLEDSLKQNFPRALATIFASEEKRLAEAGRALAESLEVLSRKSIKIPPNLNEDIIRALNHMETAADNLQNNNPFDAKKMMQQARSGLDAATQKILTTIAQAQQSGGFGGGMESLLQQLSQLTAEQMMLNQEMQGIPIPIPMPGGLTPQQLAQIERILSKQRAIRQTLEEMRQSLGVEPGLMSSLDGVIEEMKQVERDLSELVVTRELIQRQEKILNRLLDVQRSVRRREFKEKRESEVGKDYPIPPSPILPADLGERKKLLREQLFKALREGYPKDYERLIKRYFESLLNE
uniref:GAT domain-containing protein n=1 Tax=candidate division WOR-3 bacterium TaxID=2052148 RepID=A0A7C6AAP5_UNCW3